MKTQPVEPHVACLLRYAIASADMYYDEMEQRDVYLNCDEQGNFRIWGEIADEGPASAIDLFEIFLEYALCCCAWPCMAEAFSYMQDFGECLGRALAKQLKDSLPSSKSENAALQALKHIFETVGSHPTEEHVGAEARCIVANHPLEQAAQRSGLRNIELAHHGINAMCQSLIQGLDPGLTLNASPETRPEFIFTILAPGPT